MNTTESSLDKVTSKKKKQEWSQSMEANGMTKRIRVKEADNDGFIIKLNVEGDVPDPENPGESKWKYDEKEYISKVNPLASKDDDFQKKMDAMEELVSDSIEFNNV